MKKLTSYLIFFFLICSVAAQAKSENPQVTEEVVFSCSMSIADVIDSKVYLNPGKLWFCQNQWYIQNDLQQWVPLPESPLQDPEGYYICASEGGRCYNGHPAVVRVNNVYYCIKPRCEYNVSKIP